MSEFANEAFIRWCISVLPGRRAVGDVARILMENHKLAIKQGRRGPFFTHVNIAGRRNKQHRNTSRGIIAELAAVPGSPLRVLRYDRQAHVTWYHISFGAWVDEMARGLMKPIKQAADFIIRWREAHAERVRIAKLNAADDEALRDRERQRRARQHVDDAAAADAATRQRGIEALRQLTAAASKPAATPSRTMTPEEIATAEAHLAALRARRLKP